MIKSTKLTKTIRGTDGKFRTLVSYDGKTWALDASRHLTRFKRGTQLHPKLKKAATERIKATTEVRGSKMNANDGQAPIMITHVQPTRFVRAGGRKRRPLAIHQNRKLRHVKR